MQLETLTDVARTRVLAGQVLLYPGHTPPGLFVVLEGALRRLAATPGAGFRPVGPPLDATLRAFVVPSAAELARPAARGLVVERDAWILFLPRSLILTGGEVAAALAAAPLERASLGGPTAPTYTTRGESE